MFLVLEPVEIAYATAGWALFFWPGGITALKGRGLWVLAGLIVTPAIWWYSAARLGKPNSWWASRFYDSEKSQQAVERYGDVPTRRRLSVAVAIFLLTFPVVVGVGVALSS